MSEDFGGPPRRAAVRVSYVFDVLGELKYKNGLCWMETESILEKVHLAMAALDPEWR